uniref:bromodomain-containing protein 9-like n=1 Tax=Erigeron canadensis TaxID=72917 RepID=UPI001CB8A8E0|nr:bromodomain-containing protein 9-like [Erigeron canadensis]
MNAQCRNVLKDEECSKKRRKSTGKSSFEPSGVRKAQQQQSRFRALREDELRGPPSRTRASLKRRLHEPSSSKPKAEKKLSQDDRSRNGDMKHVTEAKENTGTDAISEEPMGAPSITQPLPDKQTLEFIIDTLQRKDMYEIFAEPVDPEEVADYYEIIEEPMDFGTMRAKLHEGMYTSLEQFEHDAFLIPGNAMHFNSSGTVFFRQAHGIHKLAQRVFHVLRTNPENFESEFSANRRRSSRRSHDETNELNDRTFLKTSEKRGKRCESIEVDRRSTYKPELNLNNETWSNPLIHLNQQELSYRDSLMKFVKGLGPTAQMVANRKLQNLNGKCYQTTIQQDFGKQPQIPNNQMWCNTNHRYRGLVDLNVTSTLMPAWLRQEESTSTRITLDLDFLKPNYRKMNNGGGKLEESGSRSFDVNELGLRL